MLEQPMPELSPTIQQKARPIRLLALDVDGVLTDGRLWYDNGGEELKAFHIQDGLGIKLLQSTGVTVAIITGRQSALVARRAAELGIRHVIQGREDKLLALRALCAELQLTLTEVAYLGDDLPDLSAIRSVGLGMTVADGRELVATHASYRTTKPGGFGAVREACELLMQAQGTLDGVFERYLNADLTTDNHMEPRPSR
jgi:3-deoxy-D-manno-octulosonate 8-phosphate phosphatase (KDO 8-P phosphatase)